MTALPTLDPAFLDALLRQAQDLHASAALRQVGSARMIGDLQVADLEPRSAVVLTWDNGREQAPAPGAEVILSVVVGDQLHTLRTSVLEAVQPHLRVAWPSEVLESGDRARLRVAAPDQVPLEAKVTWAGKTGDGGVVRMTESGLTLAIDALPGALVGEAVMVATELPGGRHLEIPCRIQGLHPASGFRRELLVDLTFGDLDPEAREFLHRFLQARRTDRSELLRES